MVYENMSIMNVTITGDVFNPARRYASITEKLHGKALLGGAATNVEILRLRRRVAPPFAQDDRRIE